MSGVLFTLLLCCQSLSAAVVLDAQKVVPEIVAIGVSAQVRQIFDLQLRQLPDPEDQYVIDVHLGRLTEDQFNRLKTMYGAQSQVPYSPKRDYNLIDFLPPKIQAVVNKTMQNAAYDQKKIRDLNVEFEQYPGFFSLTKNGIASFGNCWNITNEILRSDSTMNLYWPGRWEATDEFLDKGKGEIIQPADIRFGDILVFAQPYLEMGHDLAHTAFVLNSSLVFEKTDTSDNDPYRISLRQDVEAKFARLAQLDAEAGRTWLKQFRRYSSAPMPPLQLPLHGFEHHEIDLLRTLFPNLAVDRLVAGCERGLGGGCDVVHTEVMTVGVAIDPRTGRGNLVGDASDLARLKSLKLKEKDILKTCVASLLGVVRPKPDVDL